MPDVTASAAPARRRRRLAATAILAALVLAALAGTPSNAQTPGGVEPTATALATAADNTAPPQAAPTMAGAGNQDWCPPDDQTWTLGGPLVPGVAPRPLQVFGIEQCDPQQTGHPTVTVIDCSFATDHDRVYVYDTSGQMSWATRWQDAVNFNGSVWLFDAGTTGTLALVLVFQRAQDHDIAVLYDAPPGTSSAAQVINGYLQMSPPPWTAFIESDSTWLLPDGRLNENIHALVDAPLGAGTRFPPEIAQPLEVKGQPKWEVGIVDQNHSSAPDYAYSLLVAPTPFDSAISRSGFQVNSGHHLTAEPADYVFWPFLGGAASYDTGHYFDTPFHVSYDWSSRTLLGMGLSGYPIEDGFHINTLRNVFRDRVNYVDFENPMSYYDLWGNRDNRPELFIRLAYYGEGDIYLTGEALPKPVEEVNYSWNQSYPTGLLWNYKLGLLGRNPVDAVEQIGDFQVGTIPHDQLPGWVATRPWDVATFVADEGGAYASAEGIYEWAPLEGVVPDSTHGLAIVGGEKEAAQDYVLGNNRSSPAPYFNSIREGFRGEYGEPNGAVELYFSPVDRRLHLLNAQFGISNLGNDREVRYENLGGSYLNHWQVLTGGVEQASLWNLRGQLILADSTGMRLAASGDQQAVFTTSPPTDHDAWVRLGQLLSANQASVARDNLDGMLTQFGSPIVSLPGARVSDVHLSPTGFRFVCDLPARAIGAVDWTRNLAPGEYVVTYELGRGYSAQPAAKPELTVSVEPDQPLASAGQPLNLAINVSNTGGRDVRGAQVDVTATLGAQVVNLARVSADVLADTPTTVALVPWSPPSSGSWLVRARLVVPQDDAAVDGSAQVIVHVPVPTVRVANMTFWAQLGNGPLLLLLLGMGLSAGVLTLLVTARGTDDSPPNGHLGSRRKSQMDDPGGPLHDGADPARRRLARVGRWLRRR
jgi:hypothetical protein